MAIKTQRFGALDTETNIGTADYGSLAGPSITNLGINDDISPMASVEELTNSAIERNTAAEAAESPLDAATRIAKGALGSITDVKKLPSAAKSELLNTISGGNPAVSKALGNILDKCSTNKGLGRGLGGRFRSPTITCGGPGSGGGSGNCSTYSYADLLNKLTGGLFSGTGNAAESALRALMALASQGYHLGMCGVFGSLLGSDVGKSLSNMDLSMVSGGLLSGLGLEGNVNGFLDVANSSAGLTPLICNPDGIQNLYTNFNLDNGVTENGMCTLSDRMLAGGDILSDTWRTASDGLMSVENAGLCNGALSSVFGAKVANRSCSVDDLDSLGGLSEDDYWTAAYSAGEPDSDAGFSLDKFW